MVELNRAVALSMAYGPATGLSLVDQLVNVPALRNYHLLPSVRGDLLFQTPPAYLSQVAHRQALEAEGGINAAQKTGRHPFL